MQRTFLTNTDWHLRQLFNTLDPAPFHEKDLDPAAEDYLVAAVRDIRAHPSKLLVHLPAETPRDEADAALTAIRHYFVSPDGSGLARPFSLSAAPNSRTVQLAR